MNPTKTPSLARRFIGVPIGSLSTIWLVASCCPALEVRPYACPGGTVFWPGDEHAHARCVPVRGPLDCPDWTVYTEYREGGSGTVDRECELLIGPQSCPAGTYYREGGSGSVDREGGSGTVDREGGSGTVEREGGSGTVDRGTCVRYLQCSTGTVEKLCPVTVGGATYTEALCLAIPPGGGDPPCP